MESDGEGVLASHLWDSDEEDELDTHSRDRADDDEPLVPATVPARIGALREAGVEIREFSRNVVPRIQHQVTSGGQSTESDHNISNGARDRRGGSTQLDSDNESLANTVGAQFPRMSEAFDLTIADPELSDSPVLRARVPRRPQRVIREDSSEVRGPGPNLLRRGRFAALAEDDTESVDTGVQKRSHRRVDVKGSPQDGEGGCGSFGRRPLKRMSASRDVDPPKSSRTAMMSV